MRKKGAIAWDHIGVILIALLLLVLYLIFTTNIKDVILEYISNIFKGSFFG
ncbi:MAG TPA: hypothetical protein VJB89_03765 [Candidatus Nanoarchaeia archaeon]|nr:hypothetical protein [Candidatus Nanoarchaeia archaeon]